MAQKCIGIDLSTGQLTAVAFGHTVESVDPLIHAVEDAPYVAPGFIDLQVNGFAGVDYNAPETSAEAIARSLEVQFSTGVTRLLPTVITGSPDRLRDSLRNLVRARETVPHGHAIEGFHVEGPHISPEDGPRGAHPREWVRPPDIEEFKRWQEAAQGLVRLVTLSPEWPEAPRYIEEITGQGVVACIGHTGATHAQIADAVSAGATLSTHLGNGAHGVLPRHPNYLWDQIAEDRLSASLIVDGIHLPGSFLKTVIRAKGVERSVLVTDAVTPAGCEPGPYCIGGVEVELHRGGKVTLRGDDRLAGSSLRMDHGVANLMRLAGLTLLEAVSMATRNPARVGRIAGRQRGLVPGERADLVELRHDELSGEVVVERTFLSGELVYSRN